MPASGIVHQVIGAGNTVGTGDVLVNITLDDPSAAAQVCDIDFHREVMP